VPKRIPIGAERHDGFLLRASSGLGIASLRVNSDAGAGRTVKDTGLSGGTTVDLGAALIDNLILRGRLASDWELLSSSPFGYRVAVVGGQVGVGGDYYFMPVNIYVGATLSLAGITLAIQPDKNDDKNIDVRHSKAGIGLDLDVGKEWWVTGNWGMGVALRVRYLNLGAAEVVPSATGRLTSLVLGLNFSATYN
jgi:hypothetical protein